MMKDSAFFSGKPVMRGALLALVALSSVTLSTASARAADEPAAAAATAGAEPASPSPEAIAEASQRYDRGLKLYSEGEYRLAVIEFERTYELVPDHRVLYNIGQVRIQLGDYARARLALERYLKEGGSQLAPAREQAVKADLEMLDGRTATLAIQSNVAGAEVLVDGEGVGVTPLAQPILMNAGDHSIEVRKAGYRTRVLRRTLAGKDAGELAVELDEIPATPPPSMLVSPGPKADQPRNMTPAWVSWATTGALTAGAVATGILGLRAADELETLRGTKDVERPELESKERKARTLLVTSDALTAAAVVAGGISLYLTLRPPTRAEPNRDAASLGLLVGPSQLHLVGTY